MNKAFNGDYSEVTSILPSCYNKFAEAPNGVFNINLGTSIPVRGIPLGVKLYRDENCSSSSEIAGFMFPDGFKDGDPSRFDSIFDHSSTETSNRLFLTDNEMGKAYSALYNLMPELKCNGQFCGDMFMGPTTAGDTLNDSFYDYFFEINYNLNGAGQSPYQITFPSTNCPTIPTDNFTLAQGNTGILETNCTQFGTSAVVSITPCSINGSICHSPSRKFVLNVNGSPKEIYFSGKAANIPFYQFYEFSHFWQPFFSYSTTTVSPIYPEDVINLLYKPDYFPPTSSGPSLVVIKPKYNSETKRYEVSESPEAFEEASAIAPHTPIMLPPNARRQKEIMATIWESIGSEKIADTFRGYNNQVYDSRGDKAYGALRRIRGMFSNKGPALLLDHAKDCSILAETKSITIPENGLPTTFEVTISATSPNEDKEKPDGTSYQKKLTLRKNNVLQAVILFDCTEKMGRLEIIDEGSDNNLTARREKQIIYWKPNAFESYSWEARYLSDSYAIKISEKSTFERAKVISGDIHGRFLQSSWNHDPQYQSGIKNYRYRINSTGTFSLAAFDFWEQGEDKFFPEVRPADHLDHRYNYFDYKDDLLVSPHFCGDYTFPATFDNDCSSETFDDADEEAPILSNTTQTPSNSFPLTYSMFKDNSFKTIVLDNTFLGQSSWLSPTATVSLANTFTNGQLTLNGKISGCGENPTMSATIGGATVTATPYYLPSTTSYSKTLTIPYTIAEGPKTLFVSFYDNGTLCTSAPSVQVTIDRTLPDVNLVNPVNGSIYSGMLNLQASVSDIGGMDRVEYEITHEEGAYPIDPSLLLIKRYSPNYNVDINPALYPNCTQQGFKITARAYDKAGNVKATSPVTFNFCNNNGTN